MADVIMPALGMAQETGLILSWHKQPGDAVKVGDVLMEVETDKAAMEVEAQADGFLSELRANAGDEVPVGTVIAVISDEKGPAAGIPAERKMDPVDEQKAAPEPIAGQVSEPAPASVPQAPAFAASAKPDIGASRVNGKVLASPKAKRLAAERGIKLETLVSAGLSQPFRAADLDRAGAAKEQAAFAPERLRARASAAAAAFDEFAHWISGEGDVSTGMILSAFAAGAFRSATGVEQLRVALITPGQAVRLLDDPDRCGLLAIRDQNADGKPDLIVYDLTGSRLTAVELAAGDAPTFAIARSKADLTVSLAAASGQLDDTALITCLEGFAARLEEPLRQLL